MPHNKPHDEVGKPEGLPGSQADKNIRTKAHILKSGGRPTDPHIPPADSEGKPEGLAGSQIKEHELCEKGSSFTQVRSPGPRAFYPELAQGRSPGFGALIRVK